MKWAFISSAGPPTLRDADIRDRSIRNRYANTTATRPTIGSGKIRVMAPLHQLSWETWIRLQQRPAQTCGVRIVQRWSPVDKW
ncbi:MAG: hypothetical protein IPH63_12910 [Flavobacteriales bacterium]|nr:hypothetical protein [Flavobacteriales bacterium]